MMNFIRQYQTAIGFIVIVAVLFVGYQFFFAPSQEAVVSVTQTAEGGIDHDLVALLFELRGIRLDDAVFSDPLFTSLKDFGKDLVSEPIGRQNPFAPFGGSTIVPKSTP